MYVNLKFWWQKQSKLVFICCPATVRQLLVNFNVCSIDYQFGGGNPVLLIKGLSACVHTCLMGRMPTSHFVDNQPFGF